MHLLVVILGWLLSVIVVLGNGSVVLVVSTRPNLRLDAAGMFILSLAVADFCCDLTFFPMMRVCDKYNCSVAVLILRNIIPYASIANLCALVIDRFFSIILPLKYTNFIIPKRVYAILAASWIFSVLFSLVYLFHDQGFPNFFLVYGILHFVIVSLIPTLILHRHNHSLDVSGAKDSATNLDDSRSAQFNKMSAA